MNFQETERRSISSVANVETVTSKRFSTNLRNFRGTYEVEVRTLSLELSTNNRH